MSFREYAPCVPDEIERRYLTVPHKLRQVPRESIVSSSRITQGYLPPDPNRPLVTNHGRPSLNLAALTRGATNATLPVSPREAAFLATLTDPELVVCRIRCETKELCIKGPKRKGPVLRRPELAFPLEHDLLQALIVAVQPNDWIVKTRQRIRVGGHTWDVDQLDWVNGGLTIAEVELRRPGESFRIPHWIGDEVTEFPQFRNRLLMVRPFTTWTREERRSVYYGHNPFVPR